MTVPRSGARRTLARLSAPSEPGNERRAMEEVAAVVGEQGLPEKTLEKVCVEPKVQWSQISNVWHNAGARSMFYTLAGLGRWVRGLMRRRLLMAGSRPAPHQLEEVTV